MERKKGKEPSTKVKDQIGLQSLIAGPSRKEGDWVREGNQSEALEAGPQRENKVIP